MDVPALILTLMLALMPACEVEDDTFCGWNVATQGNGRGTSFVALTETLILR